MSYKFAMGNHPFSIALFSFKMPLKGKKGKVVSVNINETGPRTSALFENFHVVKRL